MTVPISATNIRVDKLTTFLSRYRSSEVIYYGENNLIAFTTYLRKPYVPTGNEKIMKISSGVEYRPDLVSYDVYGDTDLWWRILEVNNMFDIFDFQAGKTIMLPVIGG